MRGGDGNDELRSEGDAGSLFGDNSNDVLSGGDGNDALNGGGGNDQLLGEAHDDKLTGGGGTDTLTDGSEVDSLRMSTCLMTPTWGDRICRQDRPSRINNLQLVHQAPRQAVHGWTRPGG